MLSVAQQHEAELREPVGRPTLIVMTYMRGSDSDRALYAEHCAAMRSGVTIAMVEL